MLQPTRTKYRKAFKGRIKGKASRAVTLNYGQFGLKAMQPERIIFKGKKMAGHMGDKFRTMLNLEIIKSDLANNLLYVKGSIPGGKNSTLYLRESVKDVRRKTTLEKYNEMIKKTEAILIQNIDL